MNRIAIFAHYSNKNKIDDYVLFYLKELRKQVSYIEFVSDSDLPKSEVLKIKELVNHSIVCKHGEYDFGSYKRGFLYLLQNGMLANVDELIFANDSCYAPLFPFNDMFEKMSYLNNDFWGNTSNCKTEYESLNHVQSYFVVFKSKVFNSSVFKDFICSVKKQSNKNEIILNYEIGLTKKLEENDFSWNVYCDTSKKYYDSHILFFKELIKNDKSPFLKRKIPVLSNSLLFKSHFIVRFIKKVSFYDANLLIKPINNVSLNDILIFIWKIIRYYIERIKAKITYYKNREKQ